jgi:hypothetical protein
MNKVINTILKINFLPPKKSNLMLNLLFIKMSFMKIIKCTSMKSIKTLAIFQEISLIKEEKEEEKNKNLKTTLKILTDFLI